MNTTPLLKCFVTIVALVFCQGGASTPPHVIIRDEPGPNPWTHLRFATNRDPKNPEQFRFAVLGDMHTPSDYAIEGVRNCVKALNRLRPEFVMSVGDIIEGNPSIPPARVTIEEAERILVSEWDITDHLVNQLAMPFFYVPGNHDLVTQEQYLGFSPGPDDAGEIHEIVWWRRLGRTYFHFVYEDVLFLCVNTEDPPHESISDRQIKYFRAVLEKFPPPAVRWTMVFKHQPGSGVKGWDKLRTMLSAHDRRYTVFHGHIHKYYEHEHEGRKYYSLPPAFENKLGWVTMTDDGPVFELITDFDSLGEDK